MRKPVIIGNWKMHTTAVEATDLLADLKNELAEVTDVEIGVSPPFVYINTARDILKNSNIKLGAQNVYWEPAGAFTGEISAPMLKDSGCDFVIVGHSERRHLMGETDEMVNKKIKALLNTGLIPVFCVGEKLEEREEGTTQTVIRKQVESGLDDIPVEKIKEIIVAYEPVWAIGTGKTATPQQAQEVHSFIRQLIIRLADAAAAEEIRIIYGGSVKPDNIDALMTEPDIDGALVGGASLKADSFAKIVGFKLQ
ncbi:MAG: triose-phosphate isomerase [Planctomycetota bacterium]